MSESGRSKRRLALELPVVVTGTDANGRRYVESTKSRNVSAGGICFDSRREIPIGARVDLSIELPINLRRHFSGKSRYNVRAMVCRVEKGDGVSGAKSDPHRIGARFLRALD